MKEKANTLLVVERQEDANEEMIRFLIDDSGFLKPIKVVTVPEWFDDINDEERMEFIKKLEWHLLEGYDKRVVFATEMGIGVALYLAYWQGRYSALGDAYGEVFFVARDPRRGYYLSL